MLKSNIFYSKKIYLRHILPEQSRYTRLYSDKLRLDSGEKNKLVKV